MDGHQFEVIGVMKRPAASFPGQNDTRVLLPYFTMRKMFPAAKENMLMVVALSPGKLPAAIDEMRAVLRQERRVATQQAGQISTSRLPSRWWSSSGTSPRWSRW